MAVFLSPIGNGFQFLDSNGKPLNAGLLNTYAAGTTTPTATFTTSAGNVQNANPIVLGVDGRPPQEIWLTGGTAYKFVLTDSLSNLLGTYDNLKGINDPATFTQPTATLFSSGSGTYTVPTGVLHLIVRMTGAGGGGAGSGTTAGNGTAGGNTTFGAMTASGGGAGLTTGAGGAGGSAAGGDLNITGGQGGQITAATANQMGGLGGTAILGSPGGQPNIGNGGGAGQAGGGGAGAGCGATTGAGAGGGGGGYVEKLISSPSASYSYAIGASGAGGASGTSGFNGGAGGTGLIIIYEFYGA